MSKGESMQKNHKLGPGKTGDADYPRSVCGARNRNLANPLFLEFDNSKVTCGRCNKIMNKRVT